MDFLGVLLLAFSCVLVAGLPPPLEDVQQEEIKALLIKEKESEAVPPVELSREITFVHSYNDTEGKEGGQRVFSKANPVGGLENKIQNWGGVQRTVLNNKIQYNFYFWLVPKNFRSPGERRGNR